MNIEEIKEFHARLAGTGTYPDRLGWLISEHDRLTAALAAAEREMDELKDKMQLQPWRALWKAESERDAALAQLTTARNEALDEAADRIYSHLVEMGYPLRATDAADAIRALKTVPSAASEVEELREALKFCAEALRDNLSKWAYKNEPLMLQALNKAESALGEGRE